MGMITEVFIHELHGNISHNLCALKKCSKRQTLTSLHKTQKLLLADQKHVDPEQETFTQSSGIVPKEFFNEYLGNDSKVFPPIDDGKQSCDNTILIAT